MFVEIQPPDAGARVTYSVQRAWRRPALVPSQRRSFPDVLARAILRTMVGPARFAPAGIGVPIIFRLLTLLSPFGHGGECIALPVPWRAVRGGLSRSAGDSLKCPVRQPAPSATSRPGAGGLPAIARHDMTDSSPAHDRLHALLGDALHDLPPRFVSRLERILAEQPLEAPGSGRVVDITRGRQRARIDGGHGPEAWQPLPLQRECAASISRKLAGLSTIVQILDAAHHCRDEERDSPVLGAHVVEGLLVAARELFDGVEQALGETR